MLGPTGIGVLVGRPELLDTMGPFLGGGEMISDVRTDGSDWAELPWKFEAGTPPIAEAVGIGAAADYLRHVGLEAIRAHERALVAYAFDALGEIDGLRIFGPQDPDRRGAPISFSLPDLHPHDIAQLVDRDARVHPRRAPLRQAADAHPRGERHGAGERIPVQRHRRLRCPRACAAPRPGLLRELSRWADSTTSTRS